jgi:hypothetical protein
MVVYVCELSFFLAEYLWFEQVHLYTYDLVAENVGFKLAWGCLCFYPFAYCVGVWGLVDAGERLVEREAVLV